MLKENLLEYKLFQRLLDIKLMFKTRIRNTAPAKFLSDKFALSAFDKNLNNKDLIYEKEIKILHKIIREDDVVFDIGANRGEYTYYFSRQLGKIGKVFAFEPGKRAYSILSKMKTRYGLNNVFLNKIALSDETGVKELVVPFHNRQASIKSVNSIRGKIEHINTTTIDEFVQQCNLRQLNLIKCDTEGCELLVFKGGVNTINKYLPVIIVEIADIHTRRFGYTGEDVKYFLETMGYKTFYYDYKLDKLVVTNLIEYKHEGHVWSSVSNDLSNNNYIFIHEKDSRLLESLST